MKKRIVITRLLIFFMLLIVINLLSFHLFFRLDFTADKSFTLSKATKTIIKDLDQTVTVTAYFSEDLPTQLIKSRNDFKNLLVEYKNHSDRKVEFKFINPNENEPQEKLAQAEGIRPVMVNVSERDEVRQMKAYMGATVTYRDKKETVPVIQPGESAEYAITTAIKKLTTKEKKKIAFLQGHGEYNSSALQQVTEQLSILDTIDNYTINDTSEIPPFYKALIIFDPKDSIPPAHFVKLENYMNNGGNILLAYSNLYGQLNSPVVQLMPEIGMRKWLSKLGITVNDQLLLDAQCRRVTIQEPQSSFANSRLIRFPYFPIIKKFGEHPVTEGIEAVFFPFLNSISVSKKNPAINIIPIAYSSKRTGLAKPPIVIDFSKQWSAQDFTIGPQIVAVALDGLLAGKGNSKMVFFPNGKFAVNTEPGQEELNADNVNIVSNAVDWLSDNTGLIELRTKGVTYRALDPVKDSTRAFIKYLNVFLPIIFILLVGLIRKYRNQKKIRKLLEATY